MKLRRFNVDGVTTFANYRSRLALEPTLAPPMELLEDPALTELVPGEIEVPKRSFTNRLEAGKFLNELLDGARIHLPERDKGLWAWLTLFYFDEVCPADGHGRRNPRDEARLVPILDNFQRFYRHLLVGPFLIVRAHRDQPERAIAMLCNPRRTPVRRSHRRDPECTQASKDRQARCPVGWASVSGLFASWSIS